MHPATWPGPRLRPRSSTGVRARHFVVGPRRLAVAPAAGRVGGFGSKRRRSVSAGRAKPRRGGNHGPDRAENAGVRSPAHGHALTAAGIRDPALRRVLRALPPAHRRARPHLLPRDLAAAAGQTTARLGALRLRALGRRADRRGRAGPGRADRLEREGNPGPGPRASPTTRHRRDGAHGPDPGHRPRPVRGLPGLDADGHHGHRLPDLRRPAGLHARLGDGDRPDDAARARPAVACGRPDRPGPRRGVPADELHPRRRRGPGPRPGLPAAGGPGPVRSHPRAPRGRRGDRRHPQADRLRDRPHPRALRRGRPGVDLVEPTSRPCLRTAIELYGGILDEVERADYAGAHGPGQRAHRRRAQVAGAAYLSSLGARAAAA